MEKRGDLLNQLAIICDLLEKINLDTKSSLIVIDLSKEEFEKTLNKLQKKYGKEIEEVKDRFTLSLGSIDIIFSTSNV
jgi:deoxyribodipyrimidine photolyase-like uncharacterized protein